TVDHTFRLAVRAMGTCRFLGNGFSMLPSPSHHLELAHCAFTRSQPLDACVIQLIRYAFTPALRKYSAFAVDTLVELTKHSYSGSTRSGRRAKSELAIPVRVATLCPQLLQRRLRLFKIGLFRYSSRVQFSACDCLPSSLRPPTAQRVILQFRRKSRIE